MLRLMMALQRILYIYFIRDETKEDIIYDYCCANINALSELPGSAMV